MEGITKVVCNGRQLNAPEINNWRRSLVPAPAVTPAPIVYSNIVVVKTLVVNPNYAHLDFPRFDLTAFGKE